MIGQTSNVKEQTYQCSDTKEPIRYAILFI